jgi:hypothetical protein
MICRVPHARHTANSPPLPCATCTAYDKLDTFAVCYIHGTRQTGPLCRVLLHMHSAKDLSRFPGVLVCRVLWHTHSANRLFAECYTRQSVHIQLFFVFSILTSQTKYMSHISQYITQTSQYITIYHTNITYMSHKPQVHHQSTM